MFLHSINKVLTKFNLSVMIFSMEMKELPRGQLNPYILSMNYSLMLNTLLVEIKEKTGIEIKQPSLYSSLKRMEVQKLVSSYWKDSAIGGKRHYYCLTNEGRKFLEDNPIIPVKKEKDARIKKAECRKDVVMFRFCY